MKKLFFALLLLLYGLVIVAQVQSSIFTEKNAFEIYPIFMQDDHKNVPQKSMQAIDTKKLIDEDREREQIGDYPFRFGYGFDVNYSLDDGIWTEENGKRIWRLKVSSKDAYSLNFIFSELALVSGAELYIYSLDGRMVYGPVTEKQNIPYGFDFFMTDLVAGEEVIVSLFEPSSVKEISKLTISKVVHSYVNMFPFDEEKSSKVEPLSCHNDVACFQEWTESAKGVALVLLSSGQEWCSGSLLNNTNLDYKPFFLSAFHCIDVSPYNGSLSTAEISAACNWSFRFHYKKTTCNGSVVYNHVTYNYAYFRAAFVDTDFALMELINTNLSNSDVSFLGWDRTGTPPSKGTGIHHPRGSFMRISFDYNSLAPNGQPINWDGGVISPINTHWDVEYDSGTTEGGSSGSPLFDQNYRIVGQLHGGASGCAPVRKRYGQFHKSWTGGGTNSTRLSNWLDPNNTGLIYLNGTRIPLCTSPIVNFTNQTVNTNQTVTGCYVNVQNVTVTNNKKLILDAIEETIIIKDFEVILGSELEVK